MGLTIAQRVETRGDRRAASVLRTASGVTGSVYLVTLPLIYTALSYVVAAEAPGQSKALFELSIVATNVLAWPLAIMFATSGLGLRRSAPRAAIPYIALIAAALVAIAPISIAHSGYFSPDVQQQVVVLSTIVWVATAGFAPKGPTEPTHSRRASAAPEITRLDQPHHANHEWSTP
jgi:hypothetical protein